MFRCTTVTWRPVTWPPMVVLLFGFLTAFVATDSTNARADDERPATKITCTVGMVADIVRQVAGTKAEVVGLLGTGVDPHLYKPTRNDIAKLRRADVVFYSGLLLEGKMTVVLERVARSGKPVHAVTSLIDLDALLEPPEFAGHYDPHVWMDVAAWSQAVSAVADSLSAYDPANEAYYRSNARKYKEHLQSLNAYITRVIASIPEDQRVLVTAHDAFNYFGRAYGIDVRGIQGVSTASEAGLEDINRLVDLIVQRKIAAVFVESSVSAKNVRALIEGANARGHQVVIGGELFSDAMGVSGTYEGTYIGMLDHNATTIARALGGDAPPRGFQGKLKTR
jgi:manganese/zinc/iron transport system substrate-binding protein